MRLRKDEINLLVPVTTVGSMIYEALIINGYDVPWLDTIDENPSDSSNINQQADNFGMEEELGNYAVLTMNAILQPMHRFDIEDELNDILAEKEIAEVTGGGTFQDDDGRITGCDLELELSDRSARTFRAVASTIKKYGVPNGSTLAFGDKQVDVGTLRDLQAIV